jgi:hypothetical protein
MVFTFSTPITSCGVSPGAMVSQGPNSNQCTVQLTGVPNAQYTTVQLLGVTDNNAHAINTAATMGVLVGDVDGTTRVDSTDVFQVRQQSLQTPTLSNFRMDVDATGRIDSTDVFITRQQSLTSLP